MGNITYAQMRLVETANNFRKLCYIYEDGAVAKEQLLETARLLEDISGVEREYMEMDENCIQKLKRLFRQNGMVLEDLRLFSGKNARVELEVCLRAIKNTCIQSVQAGKILGDFLGYNLIPATGSKRYITNRTEELIYETGPVYYTISGVSAVSKDKGKISGDTYTCMDNRDGSTYICMCDGMGTGLEAAGISGTVIEMMEYFFDTGFSELVGIKLVNSAIVSRCEEKAFTLDLTVFDLHEGKCRMVKLGAMASYVVKKDGIEIIKSSSLPAGIFEHVEPDVEEIEIEDGDYIVMMTDGVVDALPFYDKEQEMSRIIDRIPKCSPKSMADRIKDEIMLYLGEEYKDDMTVIVTGIWKK